MRWYKLLFHSAILLIGLALLIAPAGAQTNSAPVDAVVRIGMTVDQMDRSVDFYTRVLDFKKISDSEIAGEQYERYFDIFGMRARVVQMKLGNETLELTQYLTPRGRPVPTDSRSNDRWFQHAAIVTTDMTKAYQRLREHKVRHASTGPQKLPDWNPNAGGIEAFYFLDPDDHVLEIIHFPQGKGDPKWQSATDLFAGIDHTAIVVSDTDASLAFYRDLLGMRVAGASENNGTEQEHLNNVFGARLRITALRAASGPGVEFLEYLAPRDGRAAPGEAKANDLFHWHITLTARDLDSTAANLHAHPTRLPDSTLGTSAGFFVRDPDGHVVNVVSGN